MSAEFYIRFEDEVWYKKNRESISNAIRILETFVREDDGVFYLRGLEDSAQPGRWEYDVRLFLGDASPIRLEISAHPPSIERDVALLLSKMRERSAVRVEDEDGEPSGW